MAKFDLPKVRQHRRSQAEAGFPLLRDCPNTTAIQLIRFLDCLTIAEQIDFADQLSSLDDAEAANPPKTNDEFLDLIRARPLLARHFGPSLNLVTPVAKPVDIRLVPVKLLTAALKDNGGLDGWAKIARISDDPAARVPPIPHAASYEDAIPIAPRRLRKLIDDALKMHFSADQQRLDKEHTRYVAPRDGGRVTIDVLFARPSDLRHQFDYRISADMNAGRKLWNLAYESTWRTSNRWDYVTEANADRSIGHLMRVIDQTLALA